MVLLPAKVQLILEVWWYLTKASYFMASVILYQCSHHCPFDYLVFVQKRLSYFYIYRECTSGILTCLSCIYCSVFYLNFSWHTWQVYVLIMGVWIGHPNAHFENIYLESWSLFWDRALALMMLPHKQKTLNSLTHFASKKNNTLWLTILISK